MPPTSAVYYVVHSLPLGGLGRYFLSLSMRPEGISHKSLVEREGEREEIERKEKRLREEREREKTGREERERVRRERYREREKGVIMWRKRERESEGVREREELYKNVNDANIKISVESF